MELMTDGTIPSSSVASRQNLGSLRGGESATQGRRWAARQRNCRMSCGSASISKRSLRLRKGGIAP